MMQAEPVLSPMVSFPELPSTSAFAVVLLKFPPPVTMLDSVRELQPAGLRSFAPIVAC